MKIKKMIESLEKFSKLNPDANVKLHGKCGESALFILGTKNDNETIWIESESDVNMKEEISERFKCINECSFNILFQRRCFSAPHKMMEVINP